MNLELLSFSAATGLSCTTCGRGFDFAPHLLGCPACRLEGRPGALAITYKHGPSDPMLLTASRGFWDQHRFLPITSRRNSVTLGEGETPLLHIDRLARDFGLSALWAKIETHNPTGSYKDRTNAVSISAARQFGFDRVCCVSSGNHGVSMAAYAAAGGLKGLVLLAPTAPAGVGDEIHYYGAEAVMIDTAAGSGSVLELLERLHTDHGWCISNRNAPLPTGRRFGNPFGLEGYKTMAFEIWRQLGSKSPHWCFMPVGGGDGIVGLWRGFCELKELGLADHVPRMVACQPAAGASLANALARQLEKPEPVEIGETIALSLVDTRSADQSLRAVRESHGTAIAIPDEALLDALESLGREGILVEPSSAAAVAGIGLLSDMVGRTIEGSVVAVLTGTGLRWPATFNRVRDRKPLYCAPSVNELIGAKLL